MLVDVENTPPTISVQVSTNELLSPALLEVAAQVADVDGMVESVTYYYRDYGNVAPVLLGESRSEPHRLSISATAQINILGLEGDDFRRPIQLSGSFATGSMSNAEATLQAREPSLSRSQKSLYWSWTASTTGLTIVSTEGSTFDTDLEVSIPPVQPPSERINDDFFGQAPTSLVKFQARAGANYLIRVGSLLTNTGNVKLVVDQTPRPPAAVPPPPNDNFAQRIHLPDAEFAMAATTRGATAEAGERPSRNKEAATNSVWWTWQAPRTGMVKLSAEGDFDTRLAVYADSNDFAGLRLIASNDDWVGFDSYVQFAAQSNVVYAISRGRSRW